MPQKYYYCRFFDVGFLAKVLKSIMIVFLAYKPESSQIYQVLRVSRVENL